MSKNIYSKNLADKQYKCVLKAFLATSDIMCIMGVARNKACDIMKILHEHVISLGKRPIGGLISTQTFLDFYDLHIDDFKKRAAAESELDSGVLSFTSLSEELSEGF